MTINDATAIWRSSRGSFRLLVRIGRAPLARSCSSSSNRQASNSSETTMNQPPNPNDPSWNSPRWKGIPRSYTPADVDRLRGTVHIEHTLARMGAEKFWKLLRTEPYIAALGALTGNQAVGMGQAGLKAIYLSGWQVAADGNLGGQ